MPGQLVDDRGVMLRIAMPNVREDIIDRPRVVGAPVIAHVLGQFGFQEQMYCFHEELK